MMKEYMTIAKFALHGIKPTIKRKRKVMKRDGVEVSKLFVQVHTGKTSRYYRHHEHVQPFWNLYRIVSNGPKGNDYVIHEAKHY